jgi:hypothetical protein
VSKIQKKDKIHVQQIRDTLVNGQTSRYLEPTHVLERMQEQEYVKKKVMQGINNGIT